MLHNRYIDRICLFAIGVMVLCTSLIWGKAESEKGSGRRMMGYEKRLFDQSVVHRVDISMEEGQWEQMIQQGQKEAYTVCDVTIDGERFPNAAIRTKGNTSLSTVSAMGSSRYSFKIEFDHYEKNASYYGLDKLSLNNLIQDATMMKDYLAYSLMGRMGVPSPLCSYVQVCVNGEKWGLYLAVEGIEEGFLKRNGKTGGELYKPDSMSFGGGRGNGEAFDPKGFDFGTGKEDVKLIYSDDDPDSYSNIFDNAKTDINKGDQKRLIEALKELNAEENLEERVDQEEVIRYLAVHNFLSNDDSYTGMMVHNYYLYEEKGQLAIFPWDYNLAFGGFSPGSSADSVVNSPIDSPVSSGTTDTRPLIGWIFSDEASLEKYHQVYGDFLSENVENGWLSAEIERVEELITPYVSQDESAFYSLEEFEAGVLALQTFCAFRGESVRGQLAGRIPSTKEGQKQEEAALVETGTLSLADMGGMDTSAMPGEMPDFGQMPEGMPDFEQMPEGMPDFEQMPEEMPDFGQMPGGAPDFGQMPEGMPDFGQMPEGVPDFGQMPEEESDFG